MKKLIALCLTVVLLLVAVPVISASADANPAFKVSTVETANRGDTIEVVVSVENNPGLNGFQLKIGYDADVLELINKDKPKTERPVKGDFFDTNVTEAVPYFSPYTVNPFLVTWVDSVVLPNTISGSIVTLKFKVKDAATFGKTDITVDYDAGSVYKVEVKDDAVVPGKFDSSAVFDKIKATVDVVCPHTNTELRDVKAATCKDPGYTGDTWCLDCGTKIQDGTVIAATGAHVDADGKWETDGTNHWHTCGCGTTFDKAAHKGGEATCIKKAVCEVCGTEYGAVDANNHNGDVDIRDAKEATCFKEGYTGDKYCHDCGTLIEAGKVIEKGAHNIASVWSHDDTKHWKECQTVGCGNIFEEGNHEGGEATCVKKAVCEVCGVEYGTVNADNHKNVEILNAKEATETEEGFTGDKHCKDCDVTIPGKVIAKLEHNPVLVEAKAATAAAEGNIKYYYCENCGKYYAATDEGAGDEIEKADTVIAKLAPSIVKGDKTTVTKGDKKELSFASDAALEDLIRVELDGKELKRDKDYTVKGDGINVTLTADFVSTLSAGNHTLNIVSASGTATTAFAVAETVNGNTNTGAADSSPKTEDTVDVCGVMMAVVSLVALCATVIVYKKKVR